MAPAVNRRPPNSDHFSHSVQSGRITHRALPSKPALSNTNTAPNDDAASHAQAKGDLSSQITQSALLPQSICNGPTSNSKKNEKTQEYDRREHRALHLLTASDRTTTIHGHQYGMEDIRKIHRELFNKRKLVALPDDEFDELIDCLTRSLALQDLIDVVDGRKAVPDLTLENS